MTSTSSPPERPARPSRRNAHDATGAKVDQPTGVRTHPRWPDRRKSAPLVKVGMILFFIGGLAILADVVLFASGHQDLPLWLNLSALLAPIGFGVGMVGVFVEARSAAKKSTGQQTADPTAEPTG